MERNEGEWFVLHALSGHEYKVRENIETALRQSETKYPVYEVVVPVENLYEMKKGDKKPTRRKVYPGYVFARMDLYNPRYGAENYSLNEPLWFFIRQVQGVIGFIGGNDHPMPLNAVEAEDLCRILDASTGDKPQQAAKPSVAVGDAVRITEGPFNGVQGTVKGIDLERGKVKVDLSIFGRSTEVEAEFWQVERDDQTPV